MNNRALLGSLGAILATSSFASNDPATLAKAEQLLKGADAKLASAQTLQGRYTEIDEYPGQYRDLRQTAVLTVARPGSYRLEISRFRHVNAGDPWTNSGNTTLTVSDGKREVYAFFHSHSTQVRESDETSAPKLEQAPLLAGFFTGNHSPATAYISAESDGKAQEVTVIGSTVQFSVGKLQRTVEIGNDGLIHRLVISNTANHSTRTWLLDSVTLDKPVAPSLFIYKAPSDAIPFPVGERSEGIRSGDTAPDFEVFSVDNKPVHLSDYKGKVVILEFWATWCWPCNQSIPETKRLVSKYREKGVDSFLVSIKDNRQGFDDWVKKHPQYRDLKFAFDDPVHGQAYGAFLHPSNPTLYVIGRNGKVLLKTEGYTGPSPAVEKAIEAAL